jgi:hypothetical protein
VWGKVESLLAAKLPPPALPPGSPGAAVTLRGAAASEAGSATSSPRGRTGRYSPPGSPSPHHNGHSVSGHRSPQAPAGYTVTQVTPTKSRASPPAEGNLSSPPSVQQQQPYQEVQLTVPDVADNPSAVEDPPADKDGASADSSPSHMMQHINPLFNALTTSAGSLHPGATPVTNSPGSPGGQGGLMDEVSEAVIGDTMSRVHRAVAPNATLALVMDLEWRGLRTQQAMRASMESGGAPPSVATSTAGSPR